MDRDLITLEGLLKKAKKKAKKAVRTATSTVTTAAQAVKATAQQATYQVTQEAHNRINQAKTAAQGRLQQYVQAARAEAVDIVKTAASNYAAYPMQTIDRMKNYVKQVVVDPDVMLSIAAQADIPIVSGVIASFIEVTEQLEEGATLEDIMAANPQLQSMLNNPDNQAYIQLFRDPSVNTLNTLFNQVISPEAVTNLTRLFDTIQVNLAAQADEILSRSFTIFDLVDNGKLK